MAYGLWELYYNYRSVETDLVTLLRYIDLKENNYKTTSAEIRKIILAACSLIEILYNELKKEELKNISRKQHESIPSALYKKFLDNKCELHNLSPLIQGMKFQPWLFGKKDASDNYKFTWWDAYNSIKHNESEAGTFKASIDSVTAAFVLTVFSTSKTKTDLFWNQHDPIKICTNKNYAWQKLYNSTSSLRNQIWPEYKN